LKKRSETNQVQCNHSHDNSNQKDIINYLHAACLSPVKSTWITAIKNGHFTLWPGLTEHAVEKYLSKSASTTKGHLNQQRQHTRSTKVKESKVIMTEPDLYQGIKLNTYMLQQYMQDKYTLIKRADSQWCQAKVTHIS
jgi:hypothetical protein